jgi:hypothetical protein
MDNPELPRHRQSDRHNAPVGLLISPDDNHRLVSERNAGCPIHDGLRYTNQQRVPFQDSGELLKGTLVGSINTTEGFIEFLAKPGAISDALISIGPAMDKAIDYCADHLNSRKFTEVGIDVQRQVDELHAMFSQYSRMDAEKRGEILGSFGVNAVIAEATIMPMSRAVERGARPFKLMGACDARDHSHLPDDMRKAMQNLDAVIEDAAKVERRGPLKVSHLGGSDKHVACVQQAVDQLPDELQVLLIKERIKIHAVSRCEDIVRCEPTTRAQLHPMTNAIYVAEHYLRCNEWVDEPTTIPLILRHEMGHVLDRVQTLSWKDSIFNRYLEDMKHVDTAERKALGYFGTGDERGAFEVFAEIYAQLKTPPVEADVKRRALVERVFPRTVAAIRALDLP